MLDDVQSLIPQHKCDNTHINELKQLSAEEIIPILPDLLKWIQDINWPVAQEILPVLSMFQNELIPYIIKNLQPENDDDTWKYFIINSLLPLFNEENLNPIFPVLKRIALQPTQGEITEFVFESAVEFLEKKYYVKTLS